MNTSLKLAAKKFPARIAELGFTADLPTDWIAHELAAEDVEFTDSTHEHDH